MTKSFVLYLWNTSIIQLLEDFVSYISCNIRAKEIVEVSLEEYATGKKESKIFTGFTLFSLEQKDNPPNK